VYTFSRAQIQSLDIAPVAKLEKKGLVDLSPILNQLYPIGIMDSTSFMPRPMVK
jgi:hypothetical protein